MSEAAEDRLVRRAATGDERAFAAIFRRHHQALYRFCLAIVGDAQDAQDALQNTMVKVLRALPGEERRIELKPWLYRIAHNESVELLRRRRETPELDAELPSPEPGTMERAETRERLRLLLDDLDELPERQRETLVMRELAGLAFAEIGTAIGASDAVARQAVYEARRSLRQMDEGRKMSCDAVARALSDGDGRVARGRELRAHLRACPDCRRFREEIQERRQDFAAIAPLPAIAAAGILQGLLGGAGGSGGPGVAAALGGSAGTSAMLKGAATVAVIAAVGAGAAERGGLIDAGPPADRGSSQRTEAAGPGAEPGAGPSGGRPAAGPWHPARGRDGRPGAKALGAGAPAAEAIRKGGEAAAEKGEAGPAPTSDSPSGAQGPPAQPAHGKGHEKSLPSAAQHGQQTAAAHKNAEHGSAAGSGQPAKPSHTAPPPGSGTAKGGGKAPPAPAGKGSPQPQSPAAAEHQAGSAGAAGGLVDGAPGPGP